MGKQFKSIVWIVDRKEGKLIRIEDNAQIRNGKERRRRY